MAPHPSLDPRSVKTRARKGEFSWRLRFDSWRTAVLAHLPMRWRDSGSELRVGPVPIPHAQVFSMASKVLHPVRGRIRSRSPRDELVIGINGQRQQEAPNVSGCEIRASEKPVCQRSKEVDEWTAPLCDRRRTVEKQ
ncbi:hypothetical protein Dda_0630 [Drechslerella dactyloides]|uniref:Uncharacterized protein n=1 Tax=Drechslerella dactyloides TaxID=74499 RepID=A0AAD6J6M6_DREDA|nr:hypothetical protein Dda_0630 [Drechslerella dactyloides]